MKDREIACEFYLCEGSCAKGGAGTFNQSCQHCPKYKARKGGLPRRKNLKREKQEKARIKDATNC